MFNQYIEQIYKCCKCQKSHEKFSNLPIMKSNSILQIKNLLIYKLHSKEAISAYFIKRNPQMHEKIAIICAEFTFYGNFNLQWICDYQINYLIEVIFQMIKVLFILYDKLLN